MTVAEQELLEYLRNVARLKATIERPPGFKYQSIEAYLLAKGQLFMPTPLPPAIRPMLPKACFHNAYCLARRRRLRYVEGYATGVILVHHAWCIDSENRVVDPTWGGRTDIPVGDAYFGVMFEMDVVRPAMKATGCVLEDWQRAFPILRGEGES